MNTLLAYTILLIFILFTFFNLTYSISFYDVFSRLYISDFFTNIYFYIWNVFWYIPLFISIILFTALSINLNTYHNLLGAVMISCLFLVMYEVMDYWYLNTNNYYNYTNTDGINLLLLNSINKYHPLMFYMTPIYISYIYVYKTSIFSLYPNLRYSFNKIYIFTINYSRSTILFLITFTLFLGSWWALQEGSWGGWWNWDPSEVFGLLIFFYITYLIHIHRSPINWFSMYMCIKVMGLTTLFFYIFIQLNFNLVSHNFGIKTSQFINTSQFFIVSLVTVFYYFMYVIRVFKNFCLKFLNINLSIIIHHVPKFKYISIKYQLITLVLFLEVFYSFFPLINDFLWKLLHINTLNNYLVIYDLVLVLSIVSFIYFFKITLYNWVIIYLILLHVPNYIIFTMMYFCYYNVKKVIFSHLLLIIILFNSLGYVILTDTTWALLHDATPLSAFGVLYNLVDLNFSLNNTFIEACSLKIINYTVLLGDYTIYNLSTSTEANSFLTLGYINQSMQILVNSFFNKIFLVIVSDLSVIRLLSITLVVLVLLYSHFKKLFF